MEKQPLSQPQPDNTKANYPQVREEAIYFSPSLAVDTLLGDGEINALLVGLGSLFFVCRAGSFLLVVVLLQLAVQSIDDVACQVQQCQAWNFDGGLVSHGAAQDSGSHVCGMLWWRRQKSKYFAEVLRYFLFAARLGSGDYLSR